MAESKKKPSGCLIAILVVVGLIVALVVAVYLVVKSDRGQEFFAALDVAMEAHQAPGTDAMRGIGCESPMVMTVAMMASTATGVLGGFDFQGEFDDTSKSFVEATKDVANEIVLVCHAESSGNEKSIGRNAPGCAALASAYAKAVIDGPERVIVMAQKSDGSGECGGYYGRDGKRLGGIGKDFSFVPDN